MNHKVSFSMNKTPLTQYPYRAQCSCGHGGIFRSIEDAKSDAAVHFSKLHGLFTTELGPTDQLAEVKVEGKVPPLQPPDLKEPLLVPQDIKEEALKANAAGAEIPEK